jgi:TRC40/GET3/ArsA family transport-energizing ATPase
MRVILMTGKGGVGKTSVAAATGLRCAELGYKTLVLSTDPAHSLADSFDRPLGHEPEEIRPNLWGAELDALMELEGNWGAVKRYISEVLMARGLDGVQAEELAILPGMDGITAFEFARGRRLVHAQVLQTLPRDVHGPATFSGTIVPTDRWILAAKQRSNGCALRVL